jgi:hypothetical protein
MRFTILAFLLTAQVAIAIPAKSAAFAAAGGPVWCTPDNQGSGPALYQRSKDCCAAAGGHHTHFNEVDQLCEGLMGTFYLSPLSFHQPAEVLST